LTGRKNFERGKVVFFPAQTKGGGEMVGGGFCQQKGPIFTESRKTGKTQGGSSEGKRLRGADTSQQKKKKKGGKGEIRKGICGGESKRKKGAKKKGYARGAGGGQCSDVICHVKRGHRKREWEKKEKKLYKMTNLAG